MIPVPKIRLRTALELIAGMLMFAAIAIQTARIEGLSVWPLHIAGLKAELADTRAQLAETREAFARTVAGYRAAAEQARRDDAANAARVKAEQAAINERTADDYEKRIADARARAERLREELAAARADSGGGRTTPVPGVPAAAAATAEAAGEDGFSVSDRLVATEQAIQLGELIKWVRHQAAVDPNGDPPK